MIRPTSSGSGANGPKFEPVLDEQPDRAVDRRQAEPVQRDPDQVSDGERRGRSEGRLVGDRGVSVHRPPLGLKVTVPVCRMLRRVPSESVTVERNRGSEPDQLPARRARRDEPKQRPVERIDAGRHEADPAKPEREDRVLGVAGVVRRRPLGRQHREVRLAAEKLVQSGQQVCGSVGRPRILEPPGADFGVRTAVDPPGVAISGARRAPVPKVAVVAERESTGRIVEGLGVGQLQRREARRPSKVDERRGRLAAPRPAQPRPDRRRRIGRRDGWRAGRRLRAMPRPSRTRPARNARVAR